MGSDTGGKWRLINFYVPISKVPIWQAECVEPADLWQQSDRPSNDTDRPESAGVSRSTYSANGTQFITGAQAHLTELWPPNHKMVNVTINYSSADNLDAAPRNALSVTSNEPVNGEGDGNTSPDWEVVDAHHVQLRAERLYSWACK